MDKVTELEDFYIPVVSDQGQPWDDIKLGLGAIATLWLIISAKFVVVSAIFGLIQS